MVKAQRAQMQREAWQRVGTWQGVGTWQDSPRMEGVHQSRQEEEEREERQLALLSISSYLYLVPWFICVECLVCSE